MNAEAALLLLLWWTPPVAVHDDDFPFRHLPTRAVAARMAAAAWTEAHFAAERADLSGLPSHRWQAAEAERVREIWTAAENVVFCWDVDGWAWCGAAEAMLDCQGWANRLHGLIGDAAFERGELPTLLSLRTQR